MRDYNFVTGVVLSNAVRPLTVLKPASLKVITELMLCKSTDLSIIEMRRGVEHVSEVVKRSSDSFLNGEIISFQDLIIHLSKDERFHLKITVTSVFDLGVEMRYAAKDSSNRTYTTCIRMKSTDRISDFKIGTGDRLRGAIPMLELEPNNLLPLRCGDGVIVVLKKEEGSQEIFINRASPSVKSRRSHLLKSSVEIYCPRHIQTRSISSKPLTDIDVYKKAYVKIKSKPGNMTKGSDGETLDGMSISKLTKLRNSIMN